MPLRSSGCFTCRKRKIRCDETRPGCKRCVTHGVPCPGYRTDKPGGVEFKDQTTDTVKKAQDFYKVKGSGALVKAYGTPESLVFKSEGSSSPISIGSGLSLAPGDNVFSTGLLANLPSAILSPATNRSQLYSTFIDIYLPKKTGPLDHFSFYELIATRPTEQPALLEALDALSLVSVGGLHKDRAILNESVKTYGQAMGSLVKAFAKPENAQSDDLLAAVTILASCALYDEIGQHDIAWVKHVKGTQQLIASRGPSNLNSHLSLLLFSNTRHGALIWALIERKAPYMALPEWREVSFRAPIQDSSTLFYDAAIQIPGLLERYDQLGSTLSLSTHNVDAILADCAMVESTMRDWFIDWNVLAAIEDITLYVEQPIEDFETFASQVKDRTIKTAYRFPTFPMAYLTSLYWMCMHYLRTTVQELHTLRHDLDNDWYPDQEQAVTESELFDYAISLCKIIPFFCEPASSSTGHVGIFLPMRTAAVHFTQHGHWQYAKWVGAVRMNVFNKGLSPPMIGDKPGMLKGLDKIVLRQHEKLYPWKSGRDPQSGTPVQWQSDEVCNTSNSPPWLKNMQGSAFNLHQD